MRTRRPASPPVVAFAVAAATLLLAGCLERKEIIRVHRDGAVDFKVELSGAPDEFAAGGDALPTERSGWDVEDRIETDKDGKERQTRVATRHVGARRPLPDSYAEERSREYETSLRFPTEVTVEPREDGTYYHFRRVYEPRESARFEYYSKMLEESGALKEVSGKDPEELTDEQRENVLRALRMVEAHKRAEFVRSAVESLEPPWPQDYALRLQRALLDHFAQTDLEHVLELLRQPQSAERDAQVNQFGEELIAGATRALEGELRELRVPRRQTDAFLDAYQREEKRRKVTEDLGDERWTVRVELPGELVAHNGDEVEDGFVVWHFPAKAIMDREQVLMATSRLPR